MGSPSPMAAPSPGMVPGVVELTAWKNIDERQVRATLTTDKGKFNITVDIAPGTKLEHLKAKLDVMAKQVFATAINEFWQTETQRLELVSGKFVETRDLVDKKGVEKEVSEWGSDIEKQRRQAVSAQLLNQLGIGVLGRRASQQTPSPHPQQDLSDDPAKSMAKTPEQPTLQAGSPHTMQAQSPVMPTPQQLHSQEPSAAPQALPMPGQLPQIPTPVSKTALPLSEGDARSSHQSPAPSPLIHPGATPAAKPDTSGSQTLTPAQANVRISKQIYTKPRKSKVPQGMAHSLTSSPDATRRQQEVLRDAGSPLHSPSSRVNAHQVSQPVQQQVHSPAVPRTKLPTSASESTSIGRKILNVLKPIGIVLKAIVKTILTLAIGGPLAALAFHFWVPLMYIGGVVTAVLAVAMILGGARKNNILMSYAIGGAIAAGPVTVAAATIALIGKHFYDMYEELHGRPSPSMFSSKREDRGEFEPAT